MVSCDLGLIGLAVMGQNLALNLERHGFSVAVFNRTPEKTRRFLAAAAGKRITGAETISEFCNLLSPTRRVFLMVQAGNAVDRMIAVLLPHLAAGDLLIDAGNSRWQDTERRARELEEKGIHYLGLGVSGGEEGALKGPSLMAGGTPAAYALIAEPLAAIAARVEGEPCVAHLGPGGAGHFVKMVHNGIEYGYMQIIAEVYDVLRRLGGLSEEEIGGLFERWNREETASYLLEISAEILKTRDPETGRPLVDMIKDQAREKGTGRWTVEAAMELSVPAPVIMAAVAERAMSGLGEERRLAGQKLALEEKPRERPSPEHLADLCRRALYTAQIIVYAQGLALLSAAGRELNYELRLAEVAKVWRGGCIIRARLLESIRQAFSAEPSLKNFLLHPPVTQTVLAGRRALSEAVSLAIRGGLPVPALSMSLAYLDSYRSPRLPANLLQAQRDYFGAHTFERIDKPGTFHYTWKTIRKENHEGDP